MSLKKIYCAYPPAQFVQYRKEILEAINNVCEKGPYVLGPEVSNFEDEFSAYHGSKYCVGVGSGTDALTLTLRAMGIGAGDEVITVSHTALATASAILMTGAIPVLTDIEEDFYTIDPDKIQAAITNKTKAIIPVHLYGQPCDMEKIIDIAKKYDLKVIEDCAQAHGASLNGRKVGSMGDAGCFSFYPTKNLGAIGDGGGIITNDFELSERLKRLRQYGWNEYRVSQEPSGVSRLDELQAAILRVKLKYLDSDNEKRRDIAYEYKKKLKERDLILPIERQGSRHVYHLYVVRSSNRDELKAELVESGIEAGIHYTHPIHYHPGYQPKIRISPEGLGVTDRIVKEILTFPVYPELSVSKINIFNEVTHV
jgi:dTDP-4-amino-4,6-dideoxygalactose transaminase